MNSCIKHSQIGVQSKASLMTIAALTILLAGCQCCPPRLAIGQGESLRKYLHAEGEKLLCTGVVEEQVKTNKMPLLPPPTSDYQKVSIADYCAENLDRPKDTLGNPKGWKSPEKPWTIAYGAQIDLGVDSIKANGDHAANYAPYVKRLEYKSIPVTRGDGICKLEMRVYAKDVAAVGSTALIAIHGGSWSGRQAGFRGLESQISHFTELGYVVFAPFYRLTGEKEANIECNGATWREITVDIEDALSWVQANAAKYGVTNDKIALFGQSAGAQLAAWLVTYKPEAISRGLLLYPVTDIADYLETVVQKEGSKARGLSPVSQYLGKPADSIDVRDIAVVKNSFPMQIQSNLPSAPPVFILHGASDMLSPSRQSSRLCHAYQSAMSKPGIADDTLSDGEYRKIVPCGTSVFHLLAKADHIFDLGICVEGLYCPSGDSKARQVIRDSLQQGRAWLMGGETVAGVVAR